MGIPATMLRIAHIPKNNKYAPTSTTSGFTRTYSWPDQMQLGSELV